MSLPVMHPSVDAVKAIHAEVLAAHGGSAGLRDVALLESAVAAPQATMMGEPLFSDPVEVAAAYLFYLCRNHPFIDGNKRTALATCLVFLSENGLLPEETLDADAWEQLTLDVAASHLDREETTVRLRKLLKKKDLNRNPPSISLLASPRVLCDGGSMPHRPPRKSKKPASPADKMDRAAQIEGQRRHEMATRSTLTRFQNRKSEKK